MTLLYEIIAAQQIVFSAIIYWTHWVNCIFRIMLEIMEVEFTQLQP